MAAQPKTLTVPEAGRVYFDLGRNASYEAARRGDIPTIRIVHWSKCSRPRRPSTEAYRCISS
jgi:hypothetical protein